MDLSKLSDDDLVALHGKQYNKLSDQGLQYLHEQNQPKQSSAPIDNGHPQGESTFDKLKSGMNAIQNYNPSHEQEMEAQKHPVTGMDDPGYQALGLASGESAATGLKSLGGMFRKGGDILMQKAVGATKLIPGFGESLAKEGLIGTKGMMSGQAERGMQAAGQKIGELASNIPGTIPQDEIANRVGNLASKKMTSSGYSLPQDQGVIKKILSRAEDIAKSEPISGAEMAERRALAGRSAKEAGAYKTQPSLQAKAQMASAEQAGSSQALKDAYAKSFPGDTALADADSSYGTLANASSLMDKPDSITGLSGMLGKLIPSSLLESVSGRAVIGAGKGIQRAPVGSIPLTLKGMFSKDRQ